MKESKCTRKKRQHCLNCPDLKVCKIKFGEFRGYYYGLDRMKVIMTGDLGYFLKHEFRPIIPGPKKKEEK